MSDRKLLTRRQILSVFGGATGLAIVGVEGQETSTNGNLLAGTSNMAQAYKVGEATYKGPLSVRSDVPQEDGITFIQTDAGDNNDMFAIQHYNGGWSEQGLDLPSVNTGKATINETQDTRPDADVQVQQTGMDPRLGATQPPVGARQLVHFDQIVQSDTAVTNSSPQNYGSVYRFGYLNTFPNVVPSLHALVHVGNATDGEETVVTLTNPEGNANYLEFSPGSGTGDFMFHKQTYLDSEDFGTAAGRSNLPGGGIAVEAYSTNSSDGTLYDDSNWWLEYEVV